MNVILVCKLWGKEIIPKLKRKVTTLRLLVLDSGWVDSFSKLEAMRKFIAKLEPFKFVKVNNISFDVYGVYSFLLSFVCVVLYVMHFDPHALVVFNNLLFKCDTFQSI